MKKRVIIVHGWGGSPKNDWLPWLKKELEEKGFEVEIPEMPNTDEPKINPWVSTLKKLAGKLNSDIYLVGHSIGCQTILRFLENIDGKIGGVILVAPWTKLTSESTPDEESREIAKQWIKTPINWDKIRLTGEKFVSIFSEDDPDVPVSEAKVFEKKLGGEIIVVNGHGHFNESELPLVLSKLLEQDWR